MIPTILLSIVIAAAFFAIVGKGIYNRKHHKSGCGSCGGCGGCGGGCHSCGVTVTRTPQSESSIGVSLHSLSWPGEGSSGSCPHSKGQHNQMRMGAGKGVLLFAARPFCAFEEYFQ